MSYTFISVISENNSIAFSRGLKFSHLCPAFRDDLMSWFCSQECLQQRGCLELARFSCNVEGRSTRLRLSKQTYFLTDEQFAPITPWFGGRGEHAHVDNSRRERREYGKFSPRTFRVLGALTKSFLRR